MKSASEITQSSPIVYLSQRLWSTNTETLALSHGVIYNTRHHAKSKKNRNRKSRS